MFINIAFPSFKIYFINISLKCFWFRLRHFKSLFIEVKLAVEKYHIVSSFPKIKIESSFLSG